MGFGAYRLHDEIGTYSTNRDGYSGLSVSLRVPDGIDAKIRPRQISRI